MSYGRTLGSVDTQYLHGKVEDAKNEFQAKLTAGEGIEISSANVISVSAASSTKLQLQVIGEEQNYSTIYSTYSAHPENALFEVYTNLLDWEEDEMGSRQVETGYYAKCIDSIYSEADSTLLLQFMRVDASNYAMFGNTVTITDSDGDLTVNSEVWSRDFANKPENEE